MDIFLILLIPLIIILIILIISEILTRKYDNELIQLKIKHIEQPEFYNYKVLSAGLTRSVTYFLPNPKSDINAHTDIILYCLNNDDNKFYYILLYEDRIIKKSFNDIVKSQNLNSSDNNYSFYTDIKKVKPNK